MIQCITGAQTPLPKNEIHYKAIGMDNRIFPIVQNDGIISLLVIGTSNINFIKVFPNYISEVSKYHYSIIPTLMNILCSNRIDDDSINTNQITTITKYVYNEKMQINVCSLLEILCKFDGSLIYYVRI